MLLYIVVFLSMVVSECSVSGENVGFVRRPGTLDCDVAHFYECVAQVTDFAEGYSFQISSAEQLKESCKTKTKAVSCVKDFISKCMKREDREVFDLTAGGKSTLVQELCIEGSDINTGYLKHMDCWERISNDTQYCNEMFEKSQHMLMQDDVIETLRVFHACCNFEWHKQCKYKAAETKCLDDAKEYIEQVSALLGGRILKTLCGGKDSNCYNQLYGVEAEDLDERYSKYREFSSGAGLKMSIFDMVLALFGLFLMF